MYRRRIWARPRSPRLTARASPSPKRTGKRSRMITATSNMSRRLASLRWVIVLVCMYADVCACVCACVFVHSSHAEKMTVNNDSRNAARLIV